MPLNSVRHVYQENHFYQNRMYAEILMHGQTYKKDAIQFESVEIRATK